MTARTHLPAIRSIPVATPLPASWAPPGRVLDIGQLSLALPLESPPSRAMTFCAGDADDDGVVRILAVSL